MKVKPALALILVFGFSPVWLAIGGVVLGGLSSRSHGYWDVAPWLVIVAIPFSAFTIGISLATIAVHALTPGTEERRHKFASVTFVVLCACAVLAGAYKWKRHSDQQAAIKSEEVRVLDFVRNQEAVRRDAARVDQVSVVIKSVGRDGWPVRYEISVKGQNAFYAIVDVARRSAGAEFVLRCTTTVYAGHRDGFKDPCDPPR